MQVEKYMQGYVLEDSIQDAAQAFQAARRRLKALSARG
jgi:hypothetical protein